MNRVWTDDEIDILRKDRAAGVSVPVIAAKLNRPVAATYGRARKIGTLVQPHKGWLDAEVEKLKAALKADPPLTDKQIAANLGRTITSVRWKIHHLEMTGVRDLSALGRASHPRKASAAATKASAKLRRTRTVSKGAELKATSSRRAEAKPMVAEQRRVHVPRQKSERALKRKIAVEIARVEAVLVAKLKRAEKAAAVESRTTAIAAISEHKRIIARLAAASKAARLKGDREAREVRRIKERDERRALAAEKKVEEKRLAANLAQLARAPRLQPRIDEPVKPIVVLLEPTAARPRVGAPLMTSGRGGWKTTRQAQRAKAAGGGTRTDALALADAAKEAVAKFVASKGVTRDAPSGPDAVVSRLRARGYVITRDQDGWLIDHRHAIASGEELVSFAEARGLLIEATA